jgi:hypothetical protein
MSLPDGSPSNLFGLMHIGLVTPDRHWSGEALVAWSARNALVHGCGRMDWNVQAGNAGGIRFYAGLGATPVMDRLSYRSGRGAMERLVSETRPLTRN